MNLGGIPEYRQTLNQLCLAWITFPRFLSVQGLKVTKKHLLYFVTDSKLNLYCSVNVFERFERELHKEKQFSLQKYELRIWM